LKYYSLPTVTCDSWTTIHFHFPWNWYPF